MVCGCITSHPNGGCTVPASLAPAKVWGLPRHPAMPGPRTPFSGGAEQRRARAPPEGLSPELGEGGALCQEGLLLFTPMMTSATGAGRSRRRRRESWLSSETQWTLWSGPSRLALPSKPFLHLLGLQSSDFTKPDCTKPHPHVYIVLAFLAESKSPAQPTGSSTFCAHWGGRLARGEARPALDAASLG